MDTLTDEDRKRRSLTLKPSVYYFFITVTATSWSSCNYLKPQPAALVSAAEQQADNNNTTAAETKTIELIEYCTTQTQKVLQQQLNNLSPKGKDLRANSLPTLFTYDTPNVPSVELKKAALYKALDYQVSYLSKKTSKTYQIGNILFTPNDQLEVATTLKNHPTDLDSISKHFNLYQIQGNDQKGNIHFTGYYTPTIEVSATPSPTYPYPIYAFPKGMDKLPTRADIDKNHVLQGKGLELCYAKHAIDIYIMQIQGSAIAQYPDGTQQMLLFGGSNGYKYHEVLDELVQMGGPRGATLPNVIQWCKNNPSRELELLQHNPSYIFFKKSDKQPYGAAGIPLTANHSISIDSRYVPMGSTLLASIPRTNAKGRIVGHEYRVLLAQDTGGSVSGSGHLDLYTGTGAEAQKTAESLYHYGKLWLILPKKTQPHNPNIALAQ
jgi:membrane-bound lytic murein transglycosylase A